MSSELSIPQKNFPLAIPREPVWRLSVEKYHQMIHCGILTDDDPVELLEGWLVYKMPKNPPHRIATKLIRDALAELLPSGWYVDTQEPITLADSEPEPDVMVVQGQTRDYSDRHPGGEAVALVIEVADSTLERDRNIKKALYARAGIPIYWIVNLNNNSIEVYSQPEDPDGRATYQEERVYQASEFIPVIIGNQNKIAESIGKLKIENLLP
uniref:Putative restriction endonuclease domain-containing protein n=1 Tax=Cyanothece sp. (strain PCC 7425 / ATCC 29141) TaxID=395961 RepID=B8HRA1_CYAP4